jgi:ribonuclease-3
VSTVSDKPISDKPGVSPSDLELAAGYVFQDRELFALALTHASTQKKGGDNERLEFLGDRVLGLVVADMVYQAFPGEDEGHLARRHTGLVQRAAIAAAAGALGLSPHIRLSTGEAKTGGLQKDTILADTLEALIGAIWLDGGLPPARDFIEKFWRGMLHTQGDPPMDAKTALQEWAQGRGLPVPEYRTLSRGGPEHAPVFEVEVVIPGLPLVRAAASSKRAAEKNAAQKMLETIGDMP